MSNKTNLFSDRDISDITNLFNEIQKSDGVAGLKIKDGAVSHFVANGCQLNRFEDFATECWTIAVLTKINALGYEIKKKE
jgi:hypothetical protein